MCDSFSAFERRTFFPIHGALLVRHRRYREPGLCSNRTVHAWCSLVICGNGLATKHKLFTVACYMGLIKQRSLLLNELPPTSTTAQWMGRSLSQLRYQRFVLPKHTKHCNRLSASTTFCYRPHVLQQGLVSRLRVWHSCAVRKGRCHPLQQQRA